MSAEPKPVDWSDESVDWARFPHEVKRAVEGEVLLEQINPGLTASDAGDEVIIYEREPGVDPPGVEVARVPWYRLRDWDAERMRRSAVLALERAPTHLADQLVAAIHAGAWEVIAPPDADWVACHVDGFRLFAAHRRVVVGGWPDDV